MRRRMLSPEFFTDEDIVANFDFGGRLFYQGLWCLADDSGVYEPKLLALKMKIFPGDNIPLEVLQKYLDKLIELEKIIPYDAEGKKLHWIKNFHKYQKVERPSPPSLPLPPWIKFHGEEEFGKSRHQWYYEVGEISETCRRQVGDMSPTEVKLSKEKLSKVKGSTDIRPKSELSDSESHPEPVENTCSYVDNSEEKSELPEGAFKAAEHLKERILANNPRARVPKTDKELNKWASELDKLNRIGPPGGSPDGSQAYTWAEIYRLIDWCQDDPFWSGNILSADKFRKQIVKLEAQAKRVRGDPGGNLPKNVQNALKFAMGGEP